MKKIISVVFLLMIGMLMNAQNRNENKVAAAVEQLRKAMIDGNKEELENLVSDQLSYGHSGGHIDDKKEFVEKLTTGKSDFVTMDLTEQTISISGKTAIVRHKLSATTNDGGKPGEVHLLVMLVWQQKGGKWILLARQAVKIT
ncbi:MAG TPA: nuclear transport factor 2 family protein [Chitinophagaceae bacterium]|nr:nuclear transport factor 2 family protein [Chitinophagaceae bacterium]